MFSDDNKEGCGCGLFILYWLIGAPLWIFVVSNDYDKYVWWTIGGLIALFFLLVIIVNGYLKIKDIRQDKYLEHIRLSYPHAFQKFLLRESLEELKEKTYKISENEWAAKEKEYNRIVELNKHMKEKYPKGYVYWEREHGNEIDCTKNEDEIRTFEEVANEEEIYASWIKAQKDFSKHVRNLLIKPFGCYTYNYSVNHKFIAETENNYDSQKYCIDTTSGVFKVWQFFNWGYCCDENLDYSLCNYYHENYETTKRLLNLDYNLNNSYHDKVIELITNIGQDIVVYFATSGLPTLKESIRDDNNMADFLNLTYLDDIQVKLESKNVKCADNLDDLDGITQKNTVIFVVELVSSHEQMKVTVESLISRFRSKSPLIAYFSVMKEYSIEEMIEIINKLKKEKDENEKREKEERLIAHTKEFKEQKNEILSLLEQNNIKYFYHFTDKKNVESIKLTGGLFSWKYCQDNGIEIPNAGGNDLSHNLDVRHQLQDYVRLSFCSDHPMAYRKEQEGAEIVLLHISTEVATFKSTVFSNMNATDNNHAHGTELEDLQRVNFKAVKRTCVSHEDEDFKAHQAEVMVRTFIPTRYILNINDF